MRTVFANDPYKHPISLHPVATTNVFGSDEQHSFISQQRFGPPGDIRQWIAESRIFDKPVVNLEYGYEGNPKVFVNNQSADEVRRDHYALTLAGGYGVYGNHTPWYSSYHRVGDFVLSATDTPGAQFLTILHDFFTQTNFHRLQPSQKLVNRGICAAWPNSEYIVQLPSGGSVTVDLSAARGTFAVDWFNPRTGERAPAGTTTGGGNRSFAAPDSRDWILHIFNYPLGGDGFVTIDLGPTDIESGISHLQPGDGDTTPVTIGGRTARRNLDSGSDFYFYFALSDGFLFEGNHREVFITIDYYDSGSGTLTLQYDAVGPNAYKRSDPVVLTGSNTWKAHTFHLKDAYFGNRQNNGADFRIFGGTEGTFYLDVIRASRELPGPPSPPSHPNPAENAVGVGVTSVLSWTLGAGTTAHDVYFGTSNPPPFQGRQPGTSFDPGTLNAATTYFWNIDEVNGEGITPGPIWRFTTSDVASAATLELKPAIGITIDGDPNDWALGEFVSKVRAGETISGDSALVGWDEGTLHVAGYTTNLTLPSNPTDHTATIYGRHDVDSLYFLFRLDDDDIRASHDTSMNWANDCVEIYIDPSHDRGSSSMDHSASDIQLVIDVANRKNVYMTSVEYKTRVLDGVISAVTTDSAGWWLEVQILKSALASALPGAGRFGLDFNFRDNDDNNNPTMTTVYTWSDTERSGGFPSKIPDRWGVGVLPTSSALVPTLDIKPADSINIDGDTSDWNLPEFTQVVRAGETLAGDVALVGFDGGTLYWAGRATGFGLPGNSADHTAWVYGRHDTSYLYFLVRLDDDQIQTQHGTDMNWANDCMELYIDPSGDGGSSSMTNSTSDIQLVIDAANQKNVYMTHDTYRDQILNGVTSAVWHDTTGWWLEVRIEKRALDPDLPTGESFGLDFNFRDNDDNNNRVETSVTTWSDTEESGRFPSKIPNRWGLGRLAPLP